MACTEASLPCLLFLRPFVAHFMCCPPPAMSPYRTSFPPRVLKPNRRIRGGGGATQYRLSASLDSERCVGAPLVQHMECVNFRANVRIHISEEYPYTTQIRLHVNPVGSTAASKHERPTRLLGTSELLPPRECRSPSSFFGPDPTQSQDEDRPRRD